MTKKKTTQKNKSDDSAYNEITANVLALRPATSYVLTKIVQAADKRHNNVITMINKIVELMEKATLKTSEYFEHINYIIDRLEIAERQIVELKRELRTHKQSNKKPATRKLTRK
jgi:hypothetical protein